MAECVLFTRNRVALICRECCRAKQHLDLSGVFSDTGMGLMSCKTPQRVLPAKVFVKFRMPREKVSENTH